MNKNFYQLTDLERTKLVQLNSDPDMMEVLKKFLLSSMYISGTLRKDAPADPLKNSALMLASLACSGQGEISNEALGEDLRGLFHGIQLLENAFKKIADVKPEEVKVEKDDNEAI